MPGDPQNPEVALANLDAVKRLGVGIALDDFGVLLILLSSIVPGGSFHAH